MNNFLLISFLLTLGAAEPRQKSNSMVYIENRNTKVGILLTAGGRVVYLSVNGSENILNSNPAFWDEPVEERPEISGNSGWKEYNGHIVWLGPQSEWWTKQDLNLQRRQAKAAWPPDPWIIYGEYKILEQESNRLVIRGPVSKVSGLTLKKTISVDEKGRVHFAVEATNMRREPVAWDLWLNTRLSGYARSYVPVLNRSHFRIEARRSKDVDTVDWFYKKGFFGYLPESPEEGFKQKNSKAFITPSESWMACFTGKYCMKIDFPDSDPDKVHPEQAIVEIYNRTAVDHALDLTEMEYHSDYVNLQPGQSMETSEIWTVYPYRGRHSVDSDIRFLKRKFRKE